MSANNEVCQCDVAKLKLNPFRLMDFEEKQTIYLRDRPVPKLANLICSNKKGFNRHFNVKLYEEHKWLTGCEKLKKLFCWPCLLFEGPETKSPWTSNGYSDLNNLHNAITRHEKSVSHINAFLTFKEFGKTRVDLALNEHRRISIENHNTKVKKKIGKYLRD